MQSLGSIELNPKFQYRNSKQILNSNIKIRNLVTKRRLEFRISIWVHKYIDFIIQIDTLARKIVIHRCR